MKLLRKFFNADASASFMCDATARDLSLIN